MCCVHNNNKCHLKIEGHFSSTKQLKLTTSNQQLRSKIYSILPLSCKHRTELHYTCHCHLHQSHRQLTTPGHLLDQPSVPESAALHTEQILDSNNCNGHRLTVNHCLLFPSAVISANYQTGLTLCTVTRAQMSLRKADRTLPVATFSLLRTYSISRSYCFWYQ